MSERVFEPESTAGLKQAGLSLERDRSRRPSRIFFRRADEPSRQSRRRDLALGVCFLLGISLPIAGLFLSLDASFVLEENRTLSSFPELSWHGAQLAALPAKLDLYFNDNFGFRKRLIYWLNLTKVRALAVSPSPKVVLGRSGWLFYGDSDIPYFRAVNPLSTAQLKNWQERLEERQAWLAQRGIPYLIVFAPLKSTVYPEFMPQSYNRIATVSRLDQLLAHLKAHSDLTVVDLRQAILDEKLGHQVYYRTDTHWNNRGAYVGYQQIIKSLNRSFPELEAIPPSAFEEADYSEPGRDLALILGMQPYFFDRYVDLKMIRPGAALTKRSLARRTESYRRVALTCCSSKKTSTCPEPSCSATRSPPG